MPRRVLIRRFTTTALADAFTGLEGEISADLEAAELRLHDNSTAGGRALMRADMHNRAAPNGNVGTPTYNFANDHDTGMYRVSANHLGFATGGTLRATLDNTALTLATGVDLLLGSTSLTTELADLAADVATALARNVLGDAEAQTSATDITLTALSKRVQDITITAEGKGVILPAATTLELGGPVFVIRNNGTRTFPVLANGGTFLVSIPAGGVAEFYLRDKSSAAGVWFTTGRDLQYWRTICDATLTSTLTQAVDVAVRLTDTLSLHFARNASGHPFVFAVDHSTVPATVGTPVLINATSGSIISAFRISNTKAFIVCSWNTPAPLYNITVSGTTCTVSSGASSGLWVNATFTGAPYIAQCGANSDQFVVTYLSGGVVGAQACDASGTNPTVGSQVNIAASGGQGVIACYRVTDTTALALYVDDSGTAGSPFSIRGVVLSLSGTTITVGTSAGVNDVDNANAINTGRPVCQLSATSYLIGYYQASGTLFRVVHVGVSGTTTTFGTPLTVETLALTGNYTYTDLNSNRFQQLLYPLTATTALMTWGDGSASVATRHAVITNSAGTLTAGTILYGLWTQADGGNFPQTPNGFLAFEAANGAQALFGVTINGTSLVPYSTSPNEVWFSGNNDQARFGLSGGIQFSRQAWSSSNGVGRFSRWNAFRFVANGPPRYIGQFEVNMLQSSQIPTEVAPNKAAFISGAQASGTTTSTNTIRLAILEFAA
jgi:hypothetical protein